MKFSFASIGADDVEIDPDSVIEFSNGMPGFESCHRFKLFHREGNTPTVFWMQSLDDPQVVFSLADPEMLNISYELVLNPEEEQALHAGPSDDLRLAVLLSRPAHSAHNSSKEIHAHMRTPIAINITKRRAMQLPLRNAELTIRGG